MNFRKRINNKSYACYEEVYADNSAWGDKHDAFDKDYNNIFSPVSIPSSVNSENVEFAVYVKDSDDSSIDVEIIFDKIYENTPPSKPQIKTVEFIGNKVFLKWLPNEEPDLKGYNIYFSYSFAGEIQLFEKITIENGIQFSEISSLLVNKELVISAALSAFDTCGMESVLSDYVELSFNETSMKWEWKRVEQY
jgi:hypothetical protein